MMNCRKCQKEYIPKREGGFFCSDSCGNSYRQQLKRDEQKKARLVEQGKAIEKPLTEGEKQLWPVLSELGDNAKYLLLEAEIPGDKRPADFGIRLGQFLRDCKTNMESPVVKELGVRFQAQQRIDEHTNKSK